MIKPTKKQIKTVRKILKNSIDLLIEKDFDIFNIDIVMPRNISEEAKILNRELHETTINHRLSFYLEQQIKKTKLKQLFVDIEYNRYYGNKKIVNTIEGQQSVRPDILIHSRMNDQVDIQHYLVIEAKKGQITQHDINKIEGFISDRNYFYLFGLTISYCSNETYFLANLYYYDGTRIISEEINRQK